MNIKSMMIRKGIFIIIFSLTVLITACTKQGPTDPTPVQVNLSFEVYNHTQGLIEGADFRRDNVLSETQISIPINNINAEGVDSNRGVIRTNNGSIGDLVNFTRNGVLAVDVPRQDTHYKVFLMNTGNKADYGLIDMWKNQGYGILRHPRDATWHFDNHDDPIYHIDENVAQAVVNQFHAAVWHPWGAYGSLAKVSSGGLV